MQSVTNRSFDLKVATPFPGWNWTLKRELQSIGGLSYYIDSKGIVHISGKLHPHMVIDMLRKAGIHAVICRIYSGDNNNYRNMPPLIHGFNGYNGYRYNSYGYTPYYPQRNWLHHHHHHYPIYPYY
ncbi:hypothetical protein Ddye_027787 [Dipteronia dyeriana]|uniref:HMA domain-containing protein n=1 Tax=Dipteronia dyeriana TaxID=168575 RepID=A0AAD9WRR9_9ROSI|nr:hypothetical protein Ddye_027787 [Dipteronia dyeriana]